MPAGKEPLFECQECGKKFYTEKAAERASFGDRGCPGCGGSDIDIYVGRKGKSVGKFGERTNRPISEKMLIKRAASNQKKRIQPSDQYYCGEQAKWAIGHHRKVKIGAHYYHSLNDDNYYGTYLNKRDAEFLSKCVNFVGYLSVILRQPTTDPRYAVFVREK